MTAPPRHSRRKILVADHHPLFAEGIASLLGLEFEVMEIVTDGREVAAAAQACKPDAITLDTSMPTLDNLEALRALQNLLPETELILITQDPAPGYIAGLLELGAKAIVNRCSDAREMRRAVRQALSGLIYVSPGLEEDGLSLVGRQSA